MASAVVRLEALQSVLPELLDWGCPVPFFGSLATARVATVGINPSNREFMDASGQELIGGARRLPTLRSMDLGSWEQVDCRHVQAMVAGCEQYFSGNPYDQWFRVIERILGPSDLTLYGRDASACHLDLVPFATVGKWGSLLPPQRQALLAASGDLLALLIRDSRLDYLVLNGRSVVSHFQELAGTELSAIGVPGWVLCKESLRPVQGTAYSGAVSEIAGVKLGRVIHVVGFNHNLQSSYGVTGAVVDGIGRWLERRLRRSGIEAA